MAAIRTVMMRRFGAEGPGGMTAHPMAQRMLGMVAR